MRKPSGAPDVRVLSIYNGARDEKYRYYPRGPRDLSVRLFVGCIWALFIFLIIYYLSRDERGFIGPSCLLDSWVVPTCVSTGFWYSYNISPLLIFEPIR